MSFSNIKLKPHYSVKLRMPLILFENVRSTYELKSRRKRQCFLCDTKIMKGENYINHQFRYDYTIKTISFHLPCFGL